MSGHISGYHNGEGREDATGFEWVESRDVAKYSRMHKTDLTTINNLALKNRIEMEKSWKTLKTF